MQNPYRQYQKTSITTASKEKVLLMLYEGAIRFTRQARKALEEGRVADKGRFVSKATAILSELMATLDFKIGGKLASDLENLYIFMIDKLIEGNMENDGTCFDAVESLLETLYVAWKDVVENPRPDGVPSPQMQPEEYKAYMANQSKVKNS
ncbi:MAG: flagellar export chaperone FliS [Zetaproteobacteria bacterium]|nr:flagellar export chaperone FliS [Zetaproteobacteria bacterium]